MTSNICEILLYNQQLVVITYKLIYIVKDAHHWGKNHCEIGLLWHRANHPALSSLDAMIFNEESFKLSDLTHKQLETWLQTQYCSYWCPGAKAPGRQYPQCWLNIRSIGPVSYRNITFTGNNIRKENYILKKKIPVVQRSKYYWNGEVVKVIPLLTLETLKAVVIPTAFNTFSYKKAINLSDHH